VVFRDGVFQKGKPYFDVVDDLREGDVILKGANAVDLIQDGGQFWLAIRKRELSALPYRPMAGRRVRLILPVGLEKRVYGNLDELAQQWTKRERMGAAFARYRRNFTELDAIALLTGVSAQLVAAGGVCGAEGSVWLASAENRRRKKLRKFLLTLSPLNRVYIIKIWKIAKSAPSSNIKKELEVGTMPIVSHLAEDQRDPFVI